MAYKCDEGVGQCCGAVSHVQQMLAEGGVSDPLAAPMLREAMDELYCRLLRVRSLGGDFSLVDFSPDMKVLMSQLSRMDAAVAVHQ